MQTIVTIRPEETVPGPEAVLQSQGIPASSVPSEQTLALYRSAISSYLLLAEPAGIVREISSEEFTRVFEGDGSNSPDAPLGTIYPTSAGLALFAATVGETVSAEISRLFQSNDFPSGSMLDSVASQAVEMAASCIEKAFVDHLRDKGTLNSGMATLPFSPGYCGWSITSQISLFQTLHPQEIGITLTESCLMQPLKSISGVIVAGEKEIFEFEDNFEFCDDCQTRSCRARLAALRVT